MFVHRVIPTLTLYRLTLLVPSDIIELLLYCGDNYIRFKYNVCAIDTFGTT